MALKHIGRGPKDKVTEAIASGVIESGDLVLTSGENADELLIIERDNTPVPVTSRTQNDIQVVGVNLSDAVTDGQTIPAGTSVEDFIKKLVQKKIPATYTAPTISLANNGGQAPAVVEVGSAINVNVKSTLTINDGGAIEKHAILVNDVESATGTDAELVYNESIVIEDGDIVIKSAVNYAAGAIKNDNFGNESPEGAIASGSINSEEFVITGARKAFYGAASGELPTIDSAYIRALANSKLDPKAGDIIRVSMAIGDRHLIVSLPSSRTLSQVTYLNLGDTGMLQKFTSSTVSVEGASEGNADSNNVYVFTMAAPAEAAMDFELKLA